MLRLIKPTLISNAFQNSFIQVVSTEESAWTSVQTRPHVSVTVNWKDISYPSPSIAGRKEHHSAEAVDSRGRVSVILVLVPQVSPSNFFQQRSATPPHIQH